MPAKAIKIIGFLQFRIFLPLTLLGASLLRFNGLSFLYLACLLITPLLPIPSRVTMRGATGIFLKCLVPISILPVIGHIIFHVTLVAIATPQEPYGFYFANCSTRESLLRQIGFQRLDNASIPNIIRLIVPDAVVFIMALVILLLSLRITRQNSLPSQSIDMPLIPVIKQKTTNIYMKTLSQFTLNVALLAAGVIVPSIFGGVYFITFLILLTLWGCYIPMGRKFGFVQKLLLIYTGGHLLLLHLYQFQFFQDVLPPDDLIARVLGLTGIIRTECSDVDSVYFHSDVRWSVFINPFLLLVLFWITATNSRHSNFKTKTLGDERLGSLVRTSVGTERQVFLPTSQNERLVENEELPGGRYGGISSDEGIHESVPTTTNGEEEKAKRRPWMSVMLLIMKQSYVLSLIVMMAWSITYHSWLTFVFLLTACFLWMLPNSRTWCLRSSPFVLLYAELLLLAQYIFGMNLKELPTETNEYKFDEIGLKRHSEPSLNIGLQTIYTVFMVMTLRQYISERSPTARLDQQAYVLEQRPHRVSVFEMLRHFLWVLLCKYWIIFCAIMMAVISLQDVVIYRIIYMFLFLFFVLIFQLNFTIWRRLNYIFWWIVIIYSIFILIIIYTYQFEQFHTYWTNFTGFDDTLLKDIGLERYDTTGLFVKLLTPTSFLVFVILQLRYFHTPFLKLSASDRYKIGTGDVNLNHGSDDERLAQNMTEDEDENNSASPAPDGKKFSTRNWFKNKVVSALSIWHRFTIKLWRLGEIHSFKLITLMIIVVAVEEVSALTAVYVIVLSVLVPIPKAQRLLSHLAQFWTVVIILAKMIYQLNLVETKYWITNCTLTVVGKNVTTNVTKESDNALWFGLDKIHDKKISLAYYMRFYIIILVLIACESIIRYHQRQYYNKPNVQKPIHGIIFTTITRKDADKGIVKCIKYFANYFFYKFGLECCYVMTAVTVSIRVDNMSVLYIVMVAALMMLSRKTIARIWPLYKLTLAVMLAVQFLVVLGFPIGSCIEYPWVPNSDITENLKQWLFLPDYYNPPHAAKLIADFLQLLLVSLQSYVFSVELNDERMMSYGGGDNADILDDVEQNKPNLCEDFTLDLTKGINLLKYLVFENMFWVTMAIIFVTGATRINIFSLIYVIAVFCFMWYGKEFFLKPLRSLLRMWNYLIGYCIFVLFLKTALQLVGCVYLNILIENNQCWLVQLFGINCLLSDVQSPTTTTACSVEEDDAGLAWDVVCLTFLLFQRRVYSSHYFRHIVDTLQAQNNLVSRGAELINRIMIREVNRQNEQERQILINIKKQMKALKKKQAKLKKDFKEPEEHFQAIRAGDYYLFEDDEEEDLKGDQTLPTTLTFGVAPEDPNAKPTPSQVIHTALDQGMEVAVENYDDQRGADDVEILIIEKPSKLSSGVDPEVEQGEPTSVNKLRVICNFITTIWYSAMDWLIGFCNRLSCNYRLVAKKLAKEMIIEKLKIVSKNESKKKYGQTSDETIESATSSRDVHVDIEGTSSEANNTSRMETSSMLSLDELEKEDEEEIKQQFKDNKDRLSRLTMAIGLLLASRSELLCYFLMILNQMVYGSLLSLPLPLMVFLWGMLSVPRPSKTFWITIITYTEAVVVCKYMFQFGFFPWNDGIIRDSPFFPPRIIGIEKSSNYANVDIALLLALFLHRSILRKYGLWRDAADINADLEAAGMKEQSNPNSPIRHGTTDTISLFPDMDGQNLAKTHSKIGQGMSYIVNPFTKFFKQVTQSSYNATADVYAPMFFCDFILFLVLVLSFNSFGPAETTGDGDVTSYIKDNKIPVPFLVMLILQFIFIIIDRALFLRKFVLGKFIFQILLVITIHVWMFFLLPAITKRSFFNNLAAQIWYFIKCIYFGLSAYQIRCGYPNRILGNFLTKNYAYTNLFLFKGFLAIPFLLELRALMDWIWTDSTLAIGNWLQMEDIYANIFVLKCWREIEKAYPTERAIKKRSLIKYISGGILLVVVVFIIWFPLVFFSFFNAVFISNPPFEATMSVSIGGYQPMFMTTALGDSIRTLTDAEFSTLKTHYSRDRKAYSFLSGYDASDVSLVSFDGKSLAIWGISPASQKSLIADLQNDNSTHKLMMTVENKFQREPDKSLPGEVSNLYEVNLRDKMYEDVRHKFAAMIQTANSSTNYSVTIRKLFPRFLRLASSTKAIITDVLISGPYGIGLSNISMQLRRDDSNALSEWWNLNETLQGSVFAYKADSSSSERKAYFLTFNDRKAPEALSFLSGYGWVRGGIVVMYLSFVLVAFKFIRTSFIVGRILYVHLEEAPDVDKLLELIDQIVLARELKDFWLEEELFAKLIFILRCPEVLFYMTRMRKINPVKSYRRGRRRVALLMDSNFEEEEEKTEETTSLVVPDKSIWGKFRSFELPSQFSRVAKAAHAALDKLDIGKNKKD